MSPTSIALFHNISVRVVAGLDRDKKATIVLAFSAYASISPSFLLSPRSDRRISRVRSPYVHIKFGPSVRPAGEGGEGASL